MKEYTAEEYAKLQENKKERASELVKVQMETYGFNVEREGHIFASALERAMKLSDEQLDEELKSWKVFK